MLPIGWQGVVEDTMEHYKKFPEPGHLQSNILVRTNRAIRCQKREQETCNRCQDGFWVNPKDNLDKRTCFSCHGAGLILKNKVKQDNKILWDHMEQGTEGKVISWNSYGKFYSRGYNRPNRNNTTVMVRFQDKLLSVSLAALELV